MAQQAKRAQPGSSGDGDSNGGTAASTTLAEVSRRQMAAGAEALSTFFRAAEAVQQAQLQMGQRAALLHSQAAENLRKADTPAELMTIQSTLVVYQFQEAIRYWQELGAAAAKAGQQAMRPSSQAAQEDPGGAATSATAAMVGAAMNAAAPMADALQQMFSAPLKAAQVH